MTKYSSTSSTAKLGSYVRIYYFFVKFVQRSRRIFLTGSYSTHTYMFLFAMHIVITTYS